MCKNYKLKSTEFDSYPFLLLFRETSILYVFVSVSYIVYNYNWIVGLNQILIELFCAPALKNTITMMKYENWEEPLSSNVKICNEY